MVSQDCTLEVYTLPDFEAALEWLEKLRLNYWDTPYITYNILDH